MKPLILSDGQLSAYALACGYVQKCYFNKENNIRLFAEHSCYHVQGLIGATLFWEVFESNELTKARKLYSEIKSKINKRCR